MLTWSIMSSIDAGGVLPLLIAATSHNIITLPKTLIRGIVDHYRRLLSCSLISFFAYYPFRTILTRKSWSAISSFRNRRRRNYRFQHEPEKGACIQRRRSCEAFLHTRVVTSLLLVGFSLAAPQASTSSQPSHRYCPLPFFPLQHARVYNIASLLQHGLRPPNYSLADSRYRSVPACPALDVHLERRAAHRLTHRFPIAGFNRRRLTHQLIPRMETFGFWSSCPEISTIRS